MRREEQLGEEAQERAMNCVETVIRYKEIKTKKMGDGLHMRVDS